MSAQLDEIAKRVADGLLADLRAGKIAVINIDVIRARLRGEMPPESEWFDRLEEMTTRRVVCGVK